MILWLEIAAYPFLVSLLMELFKDTHLVKLDLLSSATNIDSALNYIRNKQQQEELALDSSVNNEDNDQPSHKHTVF
jgi:hypothetical protein